MNIRLLKDKMEGEKGKEKLKTTERRGRPVIEWVKGAVIPVSDETGKKLIENGEAEEVVEEPAVESVGEEK